jgi:hypothetical protein
MNLEAGNNGKGLVRAVKEIIIIIGAESIIR